MRRARVWGKGRKVEGSRVWAILSMQRWSAERRRESAAFDDTHGTQVEAGGRGTGREPDADEGRKRSSSQPASRETHPGQNRTGSLTQTADGRPLAGHSLDSHTQTPRLTPQLSIRVAGFARADSCVARAPSHGSWALARPLLPLRSCRPPKLPVPRLSHR